MGRGGGTKGAKNANSNEKREEKCCECVCCSNNNNEEEKEEEEGWDIFDECEAGMQMQVW